MRCKGYAYIECMDLNAERHIAKPQRLQCWSLFRWFMHLHEKRCIKRAGVAGIALRAELIKICI
ncbi:hypothetical protein CYR52_08290 [Chimaeribacter arupi]|nr:hypothetical protein CYR52_08290 [Chimaeribacter arupi]